MTAAELRGLMEKVPAGEVFWDGDPTNEAPDYRSQNAPWLITEHGYALLKGDIVAASAVPDFIVALVNHAALFAELLEEREANATFKWSTRADGDFDLFDDDKFLGTVWRLSDCEWFWYTRGMSNEPAGKASTEAEAKAAVEAAIRGAK